MSVKTYCKDKDQVLVDRINACRKEKWYKLNPDDVEWLIQYFTNPENHYPITPVIARGIRAYLDSFKTDGIVTGYQGREWDMRIKGTNLTNALRGKFEDIFKTGTPFPPDLNRQKVLQSTVVKRLHGTKLTLTGLMETLLDSPTPKDWVELCRTLDRAVSTGQLQLQDGKYSLVNAGGESKNSEVPDADQAGEHTFPVTVEGLPDGEYNLLDVVTPVGNNSIYHPNVVFQKPYNQKERDYIKAAGENTAITYIEPDGNICRLTLYTNNNGAEETYYHEDIPAKIIELKFDKEFKATLVLKLVRENMLHIS